jgi:hypothetical protein
MGRFMSPDRFFFQKEMLEDPQRFNLYAYVRNNPLLMVDPSGEALQLSNDANERATQLQAACGVVGDQGCLYLYANSVATTDKDGNQQTNYYLGILSGGPSGSGPAFADLNGPTAAVSDIVNDPRVAQLSLVAPGTIVKNIDGVTQRVGKASADCKCLPGATYQSSDGQWHIALIDPRLTGGPGVLPGAYMSDGLAHRLTMGTVTGHEFGHLQFEWASGAATERSRSTHP